MLMIRGKTRPFWGQDTSSLGAEYYYSRIMLSAYLLLPHLLSTYLLFPHYAQCLPIIAAFAQCLPIIPALCSMLSGTYYSQNYASIIRPTLASAIYEA